MNLTEALEKSAIALVCASLAWAGSSVIGSASDNTRQDQQIEQLEKHAQSLDSTLQRLDESVRTLDKNVAVLNERLSK